MTTTLVKFEAARQALATAASVDEVKDIRDKAEALRAYAKQSGESLEMQNKCAEIKLRAERRGGEMLAGMDKRNGARDGKTGSHGDTPLLKDIGLNKSQSSRWQKLASLEDGEFEAYIAETVEAGHELTTKGALRLAKCVAAAADAQAPQVQLEPGIYRTIYADPPWQYGNQGTRASTDNHYHTMDIDSLCNMQLDGKPVREVAADDAHLHLWVTKDFIREGFRVMEAWGFEYKSMLVWVKPQMGIGNYWRVSHEILLFGLRGKLKFLKRDKMSWLMAKRGRHSEKPHCFRELIEQVSPSPRLEIFARKQYEGWTTYGDQVNDECVRNLFRD